MTATTTEPRVEPTAETPPTAFRGLVHTVLRLHRSALWFWMLLLVVAAGALLWVYGPGADAAWKEYWADSCDRPGADAPCDFSSGPAYNRYSTVAAFGTVLLTLAPLLTAAWAGAALIGRELEHGTAALAWTQSVSPTRWLAAELAVPAALLATGTVALTLLHRLVFSANGTLWATMGMEWHHEEIYVTNGTLLTAYTLLGLVVGALAGLLARRVLPALGLAWASLLLLLTVLGSLRPHLWPAKTLTSTLTDGYPAWTGMVLGDGALTSTGARVPDPICIDDAACLARHDIVGFYRDYHPSSHFWPLQLMETGIVLAVAAALTVAAFALLRRRTA
ncbi:ABC transporter permease [Streptomyces sp. CRN 30]|uniref:ABC transporter permease n=1 Tax=Streptomyces sp. CRN 30 TaxID=3075613 RepID=UPI002A83411D|nr:ABC transporter permease [Streptomyces sp. CRN 30]